MLNISLVPLERKDLDKLRGWRNDWRVMAWTRQYDFLNEVEHQAWFERQATDPSMRMYGVELRVETQRVLVGVAGLTSIDKHNRRAEFSLYVAPEYQHRGYGRQALRLLFAHGFDNLGLNVIWGECFDKNPALRMFEALGMKREGTRQQFYFRDGRFIDAHLISLTSEQWKASLTPSTPSPTSPSSPSPSPAA